MVNEHHFLGAQDLLAQGQAANRLGNTAPGIPDQVDVPGAHAHVSLRKDARIHAGHDGKTLAGRGFGAEPRFGPLNIGVVAKDIVDCAHPTKRTGPPSKS